VQVSANQTAAKSGEKVEAAVFVDFLCFFRSHIHRHFLKDSLNDRAVSIVRAVGDPRCRLPSSASLKNETERSGFVNISIRQGSHFDSALLVAERFWQILPLDWPMFIDLIGPI
jgi:hypothetical protein